MKHILIIVSAALAVAACAADPATTADASGDKEYRTGSNIPARTREGVQTMSPDDMERARNAAIGNTGRKPGS
ncbi:MAG: hypothetical protein ABIQ72_17860 [Usitatibacter sp.]